MHAFHQRETELVIYACDSTLDSDMKDGASSFSLSTNELGCWIIQYMGHEVGLPAPQHAPVDSGWTVSRPHDRDEAVADQRARAAEARSEGIFADTPQTLGPVFGHDFSRVRLHADTQADELARGFGAKAVTIGRQIFFARSSYAPKTPQGRRLLLHELAHVTQHDENASPRIRRQIDGCADLVNNPGMSILPGTRVHALIQADFASRVPGALSIMIPGASARPQRTGRDSPVVPPQVLGGPRAGAGYPDLARRNPAGVLSIAEIKPAVLPEIAEGEIQLMRYIDQGNAPDPQQVAWRTGNAITVVSPMLPQVYSPPTIVAPGITIRTAWCTPGLLVYATYRQDQVPVRERVPADERAREGRRHNREVAERQPRGVPAPVVVAVGAGAAVAGRALWRHFWRAVITRFAIRGAAALIAAGADGPLPIGDLIAAGMALVTIIQIGVEWNELWRQADQIASSETQ